MSYPFHPKVEVELRMAGWYPGRRLDDTQIAQWNEMRPLFPAAERALREFSGLFLRYRLAYVGKEKRGALPENASFCIDPVAAWQFNEKNETYDHYNKVFGQTYPLGFIDCFFSWGISVGGHESMLIDGRGRVFSHGSVYCLIGNSIEEAIQHLVLGEGRRWWLPEDDK